MCIGMCHFPNTSGNRVDANLLQLLDPLDKVHEYSWGTACHAWLVKELRKASMLGISQVVGNVSLLHVLFINSTCGYFLIFLPLKNQLIS